VSAKWVDKACEHTIRTDLTARVDTPIEYVKQNYGVGVPITMAYRAKNETVRIVLGDHVQQYKRLRDYLQTLMDTNPRRRCIVTIRMVPKKILAQIEGFMGCLWL
jgi:hypothetical protein